MGRQRTAIIDPLSAICPISVANNRDKRVAINRWLYSSVMRPGYGVNVAGVLTTLGQLTTPEQRVFTLMAAWLLVSAARHRCAGP